MTATTERGLDLAGIIPAVAVSVTTGFPPFLVGAMAVSVQRELGFGPATLGVSVALYFGTTSLLSPWTSRLVRAIGANKGMLAASMVGSATLLGLATVRSTLQLVALLALGGLGNAIAHPAVNTALLRRVPRRRQGLVFGVKQSAVPVATLLGGLAVPTIALTVGWRWAFVTAAVFGVTNGVVAWRGAAAADAAGTGPRPTTDRAPDDRRRGSVSPGLLLFAMAAGVGALSGNSLGVFLVDAGVRSAGLTEGTAGLVYALASIVAIVLRVGSGVLVDVRPSNTRISTIVVMLLAGAVGYLLLTVSGPVPFVLGGILAYAAGWGWTGILHYAVVDDYSDLPETATGTLLSGFAMGSASGPIVFGQVAERLSYTTVWACSVAVCVLSALLMLGALRLTPVDAPSKTAR